MKIALGIVSLFAHGGLQRDCLAVHQILCDRGHDVRLFAARCTLPKDAAPDVTILSSSAQTNHGLDLAFASAFQQATSRDFDVVVGFNKLLGLDVLYCADPSVLAQRVPSWKRLLPRYRARLLVSGNNCRIVSKTTKSTHPRFFPTNTRECLFEVR